MMSSVDPPSSAITSPPINLNLTLSLGHPSQTPVPKEQIQETREREKKSIKLFGFTINVDHIQETPTSKSRKRKYVEKLPNFFCERVMKDAGGGGDILGIKNFGQKNQVQAEQVKGKFVKELTRSDVNGCCRFMFKKQFIIDNVIPLMNDAEREKVHSIAGYYVKVFDVDTGTEHLLKFKLWPSTNNYVFTEWSQHFVKRRNLQIGDRISLSWNASRRYFSFVVLKRASKNHPRT